LDPLEGRFQPLYTQNLARLQINLVFNSNRIRKIKGAIKENMKQQSANTSQELQGFCVA
jgi:hypothetical protein